MEDIDGDGLKDLLLGDFSGNFRFYRNVGSESLPQYTDAGHLQAGGAPAEVRIYCCIGGQGDRSFDLALSHGYVWLYLRK